jgi:2-polyprenyl-3-methyl-5-hydroxy-6-metoxy-1,4-benzoquinol methylase
MSSEPAIRDQRRVWSHFQNEAQDSFLRSRPRLDFIARQIQKIRRNSLCILNVGIGEGYLEDRLLGSGHEVFAVDLDPRSVERMTARGVRAQVGRIEQMPFPASEFDVVVTSEVLEHLSEEEGQQALIEVHRVLKPNAVYLGTVPCDEDLKTSMCVCVRNAVCISIVGATSGHSHRNR